MDLSNYTSLRVCSEEEVLRQMNGANKKVEIYAPDIDGDLFSKLPLPTDLNIKLVLSKQIFDGSDDKFLDLFERVFYKSFQILLIEYLYFYLIHLTLSCIPIINLS